MSNKVNNQQYKKTEEKMIQAGLYMMEQVPFEKITVRKICEEAEVNRSTFYVHFIDINDFMVKIELKLRLELEVLYKKNIIMQTGVIPFSAESNLIFIQYIHAHKELYRVFLTNGQLFPMQQYEQYLDRIFNTFTKQSVISREELRYYLIGFQGSFTMIIRKWLEDDCRESEETIAKIVTRCVPEIWRQLKEYFFCE